MKFSNVIGISFLIFILGFSFACAPADRPSDNQDDPDSPIVIPDPEVETSAEEPVDESEEEIVYEREMVEGDDGLTTEFTEEVDGGTTITEAETGESVHFDYGPDLEMTHSLEIPEGWPDDVPIMSTFTFMGAVDGSSMGQNFINLQTFGDSEWNDVQTYYSNLPGWEVNAFGEVGDMPDTGHAMFLKNETGSITIMWGDPDDGMVIPDGKKYLLTLVYNPM